MEENKRRWPIILLMIIGLVIALLSVIFAIQNTDPVTITFLYWHIQHAPLALVLIIVFAAGLLISQILNIPSGFSKNREIRLMKKRIDELEQDLFDLSSKQFRQYSSEQEEKENLPPKDRPSRYNT